MEDKDIQFCGTIAKAASRMKIYIRKEDLGSAGLRFMWFDVDCRTRIPCPSHRDEKQAFYFACQTLVNDYLCQK